MTTASLSAKAELAARIIGAERPLRIVGSGSRQHFGETTSEEEISTLALGGVLAYEPTELFVRVGAGTRLNALRAVLAQQGQVLAGDLSGSADATIGGTLACGIDGPCRPGSGRMRDHVLGCRLLNGQGKEMGFGGNLIKNVAGFDVTRLQVGALGTLGLLTEVSLRVRGRSRHSATLVRDCAAHEALQQVNAAAAHGQPISASVWYEGRLFVRFSGSPEAARRALTISGGDEVDNAEYTVWQPLRELRWGQLKSSGPIWLCQLPALTELPFDELGIIEWHGQRRWFFADAPTDVRDQVTAKGGSAVLWRRGPGQAEVATFPPLAAELQRLHERVKNVFDPRHILNPGRRTNV